MFWMACQETLKYHLHYSYLDSFTLSEAISQMCPLSAKNEQERSRFRPTQHWEQITLALVYCTLLPRLNSVHFREQSNPHCVMQIFTRRAAWHRAYLLLPRNFCDDTYLRFLCMYLHTYVRMNECICSSQPIFSLIHTYLHMEYAPLQNTTHTYHTGVDLLPDTDFNLHFLWGQKSAWWSILTCKSFWWGSR